MDFVPESKSWSFPIPTFSKRQIFTSTGQPHAHKVEDNSLFYSRTRAWEPNFARIPKFKYVQVRHTQVHYTKGNGLVQFSMGTFRLGQHVDNSVQEVTLTQRQFVRFLRTGKFKERKSIIRKVGKQREVRKLMGAIK